MNIVAYILTSITIIIGMFVAFVGYQQYRVNKERFKLDLFAKRFSVYKGTQVFLSHILSYANVDLDKLFQFRAETQDAVFLFDDDITNYLDLIDKKALDLWSTNQELVDLPNSPKKSELNKKKTKLLKWLMDELPRLKEVFSPYLKFKTWK